MEKTSTDPNWCHNSCNNIAQQEEIRVEVQDALKGIPAHNIAENLALHAENSSTTPVCVIEGNGTMETAVQRR